MVFSTACARFDCIGSISAAVSVFVGGEISIVLPSLADSAGGATFSYASRTSFATRFQEMPLSRWTPSQPRGPT